MEVTASSPPKPLTQTRATYRIDSIDFLRGLIMIIMALDHTRDFFHEGAFTADPLNLSTTTPILFFTRWITHFCAPIFVFLAGASAYLQGLRKDKKQLSGFLIKRGLWLILIEVFVMSFLISFDIRYSNIFLQTIWSIGISMVLLGLAVRFLSFSAILVFGILIVFGHNLLDFYEAKHQGSFGFFYDLLHRQTAYPFWDNHTLLILYPFLSWIGLMFLGYCFGKLFTIAKEPAQRRKMFTTIGLGVILLFVILRAIDIYGDPKPWSTQKNFLYSLFSFVNTQKYPPSLLFMCMTIGPAILFLGWVHKVQDAFSRFVTVFGRVPFLYYILHFFVLHFLCMIVFVANGNSLADGWNNPAIFIKFIIPGKGYDLATVYLIWFGVVLALYPVCKWFSDYKRTHKQWWLSYL